MKNELFDSNNSFIEQKAAKIYCKCNRKALFACHMCKAFNTIICSQKSCECKNDHNCCLSLNLSELMKNCLKGEEILNGIKIFIAQKITDLIDKLSQLDNKIQKELKNIQPLKLTSELYIKFFEIIENGDLSQLNRHFLWNLVKQVGEQKQTGIQQQMKTELENICNSLDGHIKQFQNSMISWIDRKRNPSNKLQNLSKISKVVTSQIQTTMLFKFLEIPVKSMKLLFRASQNNFDVMKFREKSDGIGNTLTLVETEHKHKIGGFTPLKWSNSNTDYQSDQSQKSFQIYNDKTKAIDNDPSFGPAFGDSDLFIADNQGQKNICTFYRNIYKNKKSSTESRQAKRKFKTIQWEVWQLEFQAP